MSVLPGPCAARGAAWVARHCGSNAQLLRESQGPSEAQGDATAEHPEPGLKLRDEVGVWAGRGPLRLFSWRLPRKR